MERRYRDFNSYLKSLFGCRVQKIPIDAGLGCPNRDGKISLKGCIYCNSLGSGTGAFKKGLSISQQIDLGKEELKKRYGARKFIAYFQSFTNTYGPIEKLKSLYDEAIKDPDIIGLSIGTRPDCISREVLDLLEGYAKKYLVWLEYGLQSSHDRTLSFINRGHDWNCFKNAVEMTKNRGILICAHIILGLPGEDREDMIETARRISAIGIDGIKIHCLYIVRGTKMEEMYLCGQYSCLEQNEYIEIVCDILENLHPDIIIQRLTSDPNPSELVAPIWTLRKSETLNLIFECLKRRNSYQGKSFKKP